MQDANADWDRVWQLFTALTVCVLLLLETNNAEHTDSSRRALT